MMVRFRRPRYGSKDVLRLLKPPPAAPEATEDPLETLARAAARGDRRAQRTLFVTLGPLLLGIVRGVLGGGHPDVEDVLQEVLVALHGALPSFRGECRTSHFAGRVALHTAMNARRRAGYRTRFTPSTAPEDLVEVPIEGPSPAEARGAAERREALLRLLDMLPAVQAEVLALHVVLGYSVDETAAASGAPRDTVRSRLRAALATLRRRVESDGALLELLGGST
jgi:RNA polymerase sigma-70 factor (ECF subfamily)